MKSGTIPNLGKNRSHPSTSSFYVGGKLFCLVEVCPPFQVSIDPETGRAESGNFDDMDGRIEVGSSGDSRIEVGGSGDGRIAVGGSGDNRKEMYGENGMDGCDSSGSPG